MQNMLVIMASRSEFDDLLANGITPIQQFDSNKEGVPHGPERDTYWLCSMPWGGRSRSAGPRTGEHGWRPDDVLEDQFWVDFSNAYLTEAAKAPQGSRRSTSYFG
ncbi:uncharacterized protein GLRG_07980 [Colletotrichum graminicola M1.001]|uniref:Uncharacterized protein n=1 Tax=Colletotrichum graminicola (strain M1.001 / M2 / FGSC 10212) TaxID=645133 RepID=E3QPQ9_COLGM|nr:uncharacterized protein GLRG_07980 [Colletotrichum graminicola M1.001]EFQ32836.1 hypothetical protein GLRG_07980 [Colletotrichum graminicola M1.001]